MMHDNIITETFYGNLRYVFIFQVLHTLSYLKHQLADMKRIGIMHLIIALEVQGENFVRNNAVTGPPA